VPESRILAGVIGRPHGVRGLVRVVSYTADPADLSAYGPVSDSRGRRFDVRWRGEGIAEVSEIVAGGRVAVQDRGTAEKLTNTRLYVGRDRLPRTAEDEFYLADLLGLAAVDEAGAVLGRVGEVHDYGAGASLEIERGAGPPLLVPFTKACVPDVNIAAGRLTVLPPLETDAPGVAAA
jgi:16S rRNA processing protein RimM